MAKDKAPETRGKRLLIRRNIPDPTKFNRKASLPYQLRVQDFELALQDVYDFFFDVNTFLASKGLERLDDMVRSAILSGLISDMLTASLSKHSRTLAVNSYHNGHPDLIVRGRYAKDAVQAGSEGIEVKITQKAGGAVDTHGARNQWLCVFVYEVDHETEPTSNRAPLTFTEVYLAQVGIDDFRKNARGELGTRTATLHKDGIAKLRKGWIYKHR